MKKTLLIFTAFAISFVISGHFVFAGELNLDAYGTFGGDNIVVVQKTIHVYKGWNLIQGLAGREWITGGIDVAKSDIKAIFGLNPLSKKYVRFYPTPEKEKMNELSAIPFMTYWVYSNKNGTLNYETSKSRTLEFIWPTGWNIISITSDMFDGDPFAGGTFSWNSIKGSCNFEKIYAWNPENNEWMTISPDLSSNDFNDFLGSGMLVKLSNECKLDKPTNKDSVQPPQLPN